MNPSALPSLGTPSSSRPDDQDLHASLEKLGHMIEHAAHYLPAQGPITVFVHHNTLHAFEDLPFHQAVRKGARMFGCQPYLSEDRYRQELGKGRIRREDLVAVLREELGEAAGEAILSFGTREELRLAMLQHAVQQAPDAELHWFVAETDALKRYRGDVASAVRERFREETRHWVMRDVRTGHAVTGDGEKARTEKRWREGMTDLVRRFGEGSIERWSAERWEAFALQALWRICRDGVHGLKLTGPAEAPAQRHRDLLLAAAGEDIDVPVNDLLIRFCAAYLDQGLSPWPLPDREQGFYRAFLSLYQKSAGPPDAWLKKLRGELARHEGAGMTPLESIHESFRLLGVEEWEWEELITTTLLSLRGWAGMIWQMEVRGDRVPSPASPGSLAGFLAVRLVLERMALAYYARETLGYDGPLALLRDRLRGKLPRHDTLSVDQRGFLVFQIAQAMGWSPARLAVLSKAEWATLLGEIEAFGGVERRRVFHEAFERRYRLQTLDAVALQSAQSTARVADPRFQVVCCIDEREESFLRHLEELCPAVETFSVAGFFGVAIYYRGAGEAHFVPQCPIVVRPQHWVVEDVVYSLEEAHQRRARARRALGAASHLLHLGSRTFAGGAILAAVLGVLASIPLVARVLFPRLTARIRKMFGRLVQPPPMTRLRLERSAPAPSVEGDAIGFSLEEMADAAERVLRDLGLTSGFARLVLILGHGSNSLNNPHNSAYNCGACAGSAGGPNARALAQVLNDPRVREILEDRGLVIPRSTVFVGGLHNTCNDQVRFYDLDWIPHSHHADFEQAQEVIERACERNAHERCRRFQSAPLDMSFAAAHRHVEERSEDLAQTRPECGHATNAICVVGRRSRTRGLFLDRRAFLNSYDPTQDDAENTILTRILQAAVPVCAGINLEYYFSYVDPTGWGCGTKLPHNVASLLGVMNGAASDLRTGLPWQMVEIHEPVRLLFIIETTPEAILRIMDRNEAIGRLIRNGWVQLATLDPHSSRVHVYRNGSFVEHRAETAELPRVGSWVEWYRGWREHLGFAVLRPPQAGTAAAAQGQSCPVTVGGR